MAAKTMIRCADDELLTFILIGGSGYFFSSSSISDVTKGLHKRFIDC